MMRGLPQKGAYETVLRDALTTDTLNPLGLYLGTRSGQLFGSRDEGKSWERILEGLPPVLCVRSVLVEDAAGDAPATTARSTGPTLARQTRTAAKTSRRATTKTKTRRSKK
jgi:hypothetical protein